MVGQGVNVVSAIAEDAGVPVDVTDFRLSGDDAFEARPGCGAHLMVLYAWKNFEISLYGPEAFGRNRVEGVWDAGRHGRGSSKQEDQETEEDRMKPAPACASCESTSGVTYSSSIIRNGVDMNSRWTSAGLSHLEMAT